jgi:hypothetical protein
LRRPDGTVTPAAHGIIFRLSYVNAQNQPVSLWSQAVDRGTSETDVDLRGIPSANLILETLPVETGAASPYWADIHFDP